MLTHDEELWEKHLPPAVEELLSQAKDPLADRSDRCEREREREKRERGGEKERREREGRGWVMERIKEG